MSRERGQARREKEGGRSMRRVNLGSLEKLESSQGCGWWWGGTWAGRGQGVWLVRWCGRW